MKFIIRRLMDFKVGIFRISPIANSEGPGLNAALGVC